MGAVFCLLIAPFVLYQWISADASRSNGGDNNCVGLIICLNSENELYIVKTLFSNFGVIKYKIGVLRLEANSFLIYCDVGAESFWN